MSFHFSPEQNTYLIALFMKYPVIGFLLTISLGISGYKVPNMLLEAQIPILYMQLIQILVWFIAGTAGILTIVAAVKKMKK